MNGEMKEGPKERSVQGSSERLENVVFLISQPRAGSTMTQKMLGSHSLVHTQAEPWVLLHPLHSLRHDNLSATYNHKVNVRGTREFAASLPGGEETYWRELGDAYLRMYSSVLRAESKSIFLDKTPRYYLVARDLPRLFPDCRIICLIRNPLAVLNSIISTWAREKLFTLCRYRQDLLEAPGLIADLIAAGGAHTICIRYEDLVADPEAGMKSLCLELGVNYEPAMLGYARDRVFKMGDRKSVDRLTGPDLSLIDGWIAALADPQIWRLQSEYFAVLGMDVFASLGYDPVNIRDLLEARRPSATALSNTISLEVLLDDQRDPLLGLHRLQRELEVLRRDLKRVTGSWEYRLGRVLSGPLGLVRRSGRGGGEKK